ncbi:MAG: FtsQ-type POTRA domain-containing protein [Tissierellia bacterium]|nr:FtsQ-type POTRA domain-containing protein [Tissierellia bacterium]MDD4779686.1 FtsQ-type POTRA domain-containing protein [Tissierellia bacterium]
MARDKSNNKKRRKKRRKKKKISKLFVSTAAFFSAAVVVVFCIYYIAFETDYLNIASVKIEGNNYYEKDYLIEKAGITIGEKLYKVDREKVKEEIEKETYINNVRVLYALPNKILIKVTERKEQYLVFFNNEYIAIDTEGRVLNIYNTKNNLLTIESLTNVRYNIGETIAFEGLENINTIFETLEYLSNVFGSETITKLTVATNNSILLDTEYGAKIKIDLNEDIKYQITFAMKIITERLNNNLTVSSGIIDFTKGDNPVYIEDYQMEETNEQNLE